MQLNRGIVASHFFLEKCPKNVSRLSLRSIRAFSRCDDADFIVSGGGLVGLATGCALGKNRRLSNRKTIVLERGPRPARVVMEQNVYKNRVVALNPGTKEFLESLNVWQKVPRFQPVKKLQVWESHSDAAITFNSPVSSEAVTYIVENDLLLDAMRCVIEEELRDTVQLRNSVVVSGYNIVGENQFPEVTLEGEEASLKCQLLIGADGNSSPLRKHLGIQTMRRDYHHRAIVATLLLAEEHGNSPESNDTAWQRFVDPGPIALLPLASGMSSLVWSGPDAQMRRLMEFSDVDFVDALNDALSQQKTSSPWVNSVLQAVKRVNPFPVEKSATIRPPVIQGIVPGSKAAFPLAVTHATSYVAPRVVLIGDAGHQVHPMAGLGVNLGFGDVEALSRRLGEAAYLGQDVGSRQALLQYNAERQRNNVPILLTIDGLHRLYSLTLPPIVMLRGLGLSLVDAMNPLKRLLMKGASRT